MSSQTSAAVRAPVTTSWLALLAGFVILGALAAWASPQMDHALNPGAAQPGVISYLGVGLTVLALTALLLFYGLRGLIPRTAVFLVAAFGYNALLIAVKLGLGPLAIYVQNTYYVQHALPPGATGFNPGFTFLTAALSYPGLAAITAVLYGIAFFVLYLIFQARLEQKLGIPVRVEKRFIQLFVIMFILAAVGGVTIIGLLGFLEYASTVLVAGAVGILIGIALVGAIALCSVAFKEATEQAALVRNVTLLSSFAWTGLAFIAAYHILWLVFLLTLVSIWPLRPWSWVGGGTK